MCFTFDLYFQEHVFWVVSLNTLFILVFGKYHLHNKLASFLWASQNRWDGGCLFLGLKLVLHDCNLTLNSGAAQNYKYVFGLHSIHCLISETLQLNINKHKTDMKESRGLNGVCNKNKKKMQTQVDHNGSDHRMLRWKSIHVCTLLVYQNIHCVSNIFCNTEQK